MKTRIMVVDDDPNIRELVRLYLEKEGFEIVTAERGDEAVKLFRASPPNLMLLDVMLPGMDGWQVCREVRKISNIPIIMLTAKDETFDKVLGLELGADDYIVKPFDMKELVARIKAVIRRFQAADTPEKELVFPGLTINISQYTVTYMGKALDMPPREIELLYFLASHPGMVFTREQLLEQVWGYDYFGDSRTVDVHVKRLREKLSGGEELGWQIKTVWGVGYKFEVK
ncbi:MAG TPA: response regulator transcription factor [Candidatus Pullichristensenella stercorigallinarum]|uniref:Stage 0 sporulation protein A homolog n=1 Tax=Candidatus Pullichristensenella stercorigallinarum TaxID=2840909 RepID=A0A9D0ZKQ5_9FIRM|nr:response regulator transcription factor [Candidatus Pullichristensenella stercorigallinarum]